LSFVVECVSGGGKGEGWRGEEVTAGREDGQGDGEGVEPALRKMGAVSEVHKVAGHLPTRVCWEVRKAGGRANVAEWRRGGAGAWRLPGRIKHVHYIPVFPFTLSLEPPHRKKHGLTPPQSCLSASVTALP
jgi:hypothetical protein